MAVTWPHHHLSSKPHKQARRTATTVLAGNFDLRPQRDVLTSLLNGVGPYTPLLRTDDDEARRQRKREKKARERERKRARLAAQVDEKAGDDGAAETVSAPGAFPIAMPRPSASTSTFWRGHARPSIHIATMQRSVSVTPPPFTSPLLLPSTPASTPGPSNSSSTSRTSSKRPRTPDDYEELVAHHERAVSHAPRKPRAAAKKGWKGWVEGSPPPSEKLINLDAVPVLQERRTRSGKNFDAIGVGKEGWV
ncbi:hypothetical protein FB451DRAFT_53688 [Mycena latifolia]|nr:hypothetical protein FB451DRAFT_53688 [Mycena latifolia]